MRYNKSITWLDHHDDDKDGQDNIHHQPNQSIPHWTFDSQLGSSKDGVFGEKNYCSDQEDKSAPVTVFIVACEASKFPNSLDCKQIYNSLLVYTC